MFSFSAATLERLRAAGWSEDTEADVEWYSDKMAQEGFSLNEPAREFVRRFGSITISHPHHTVPSMVDWFEINPAAAVRTVFPEWIQLWSDYVGEELSVVGWANRMYLTLIMGTSGRVWAAIDTLVLEVAPTGEEAIEVLASGKKLKRLGYLRIDADETSSAEGPTD